jgi:hypothetical protein
MRALTIIALGVLLSSPVQAGATLDQSLATVRKSLDWCRSITWKTYEQAAGCEQTALSGAYDGTPWELYT